MIIEIITTRAHSLHQTWQIDRWHTTLTRKSAYAHVLPAYANYLQYILVLCRSANALMLLQCTYYFQQHWDGTIVFTLAALHLMSRLITAIFFLPRVSYSPFFLLFLPIDSTGNDRRIEWGGWWWWDNIELRPTDVRTYEHASRSANSICETDIRRMT